MVTRWAAGPDPPGYDQRLTLANFVYDAARQGDYVMRDLHVRILPDEGLRRQLTHDVTGWIIPVVAGADEIVLGDSYVAYDALEILWQVYTPASGAAGTALGDFPAGRHAEVVAAVIATYIARNIWAVDAATQRLEDPPLRRGWFKGVNSYQRVQSDAPGWLQSVVSTDCIAYVADERTPAVLDRTVIKGVDYVRFGLGADEMARQYRRYDVATGRWSDE